MDYKQAIAAIKVCHTPKQLFRLRSRLEGLFPMREQDCAGNEPVARCWWAAYDWFVYRDFR